MFKINELRVKNNLSQKELAKIIGLEYTLYNKYEKEYVTIPLKHLNTLCNYFNVSLDYMLNFTTTKTYPNYTKEIDKTLTGKRLKEFRKENNLTQEKLAKKLNTTHSVIADYEKGRFLISTSFIYYICSNYKISADYLLGKTDSPKYLK